MLFFPESRALDIENLSLGILIPTWDRPDQVSARLAEIALQFGCDQRVHVQVNPGDYDSSSIGYSPLQSAITVGQNQTNVGFVANILLGIINLDDEWVWILGDDDSLSPACASTVRQALSMASGDTIAVVFNQWGRKMIENYRCTESLHLFSSTTFGDALFVSGTVWRRTYFIKHLELFVVQAFSCASQVALLIEGLEKKHGDVLVFNQSLIDYQPVHRWSRFQFVQRMATLLDLDMSGPTRAKLAYLLYPQLIWATKSAFQQVADGDVSLIELLSRSTSAMLRILWCDPLIPMKEVLSYSASKASKYNQVLKTHLAISKHNIKNLIKHLGFG